MARHYRSPLTGDVWVDPRPAVGTLAGLANFLNEKRPRRKPPAGHDEAIALATAAAAAFAGIPRITRTGIEGTQASDAYWQAKEAKQKLTALVDDGIFIQRSDWWGEEHERRRRGDSYGYSDTYAQAGVQISLSMRAARTAWFAAHLTEKSVASIGEALDNYHYAHRAVLGTLAELDDGGVPREAARGVERVWRFVVAAGRMPVPGVDDDLLAAFEAALMAGENDFAAHLARNGWGQNQGST